jgi:hypothetical protein
MAFLHHKKAGKMEDPGAGAKPAAAYAALALEGLSKFLSCG